MWVLNCLVVGLVALVVGAIVEWVGILVVEPLIERKKYKKILKEMQENA